MATADGVSKIGKSRKTIIELLAARGYNTSDYEGFSMNEIHVMMQNNQLDMLIESEEGRKVYIKYHLSKTLRPQNISDIVEDLYEIEQVLSKDVSLEAHGEKSYQWIFQLATDSPITDKQGGPYLLFGGENTLSEGGRLDLPIKMHTILQNFLQTFTTQFFFLEKSFVL